MSIVQDDEGDWELESANLRQIYSASVLTIGANTINCHSEGLSATRNTRTQRILVSVRPTEQATI